MFARQKPFVLDKMVEFLEIPPGNTVDMKNRIDTYLSVIANHINSFENCDKLVIVFLNVNEV